MNTTPLLDLAPVRALRHLTTALRAQYAPRGDDEPAFVRGGIPFLGVALDYGRDAGAFLRAQQERHGDVFTVFLAGQRMMFLLDPLEWPTVLLDDRLDFHQLANEISAKAFDHTLESLDRLDMDAVTRLTIDRMRGEDLAVMTRRMQEKLEGVLLHREPPRADGLYGFVSRVVFLASSDALFGDDFATEEVHGHFDAFDRKFPMLAAGVPSRLLPGVDIARAALRRRFAVEYANASALMLERQRMFDGVVSDKDRLAYHVGLTWAAVANTIPATFWSLFFVARDPVARDAIEAEVRGVIAEAERDPETGRPVFDRAALSQMVQLDSAIDEAFRMTSGSLVIRVARDACTLRLRDGRELPLRAGDQVAFYPYLTHHDPALYPEPERYRHDRFLEDGKPKRVFMLRGERVRHYLMPFGGGVSICPGRHFARNEIKQTVAMLLNDFDLEITDPDVPPLDQTRAGLGILPPARDVGFRLRRV